MATDKNINPEAEFGLANDPAIDALSGDYSGIQIVDMGEAEEEVNAAEVSSSESDDAEGDMDVPETEMDGTRGSEESAVPEQTEEGKAGQTDQAEAKEHLDPVSAATASTRHKINDYEQESVFLNDEEARKQPIETAKLDNPQQLMAAVESILFTMGEAVEISDIAKALEKKDKEIKQAISFLEEKYDLPESGIMIQHYGSAVQMSTKPEQYGNLIKIASVPRKMSLSDSVIETLSIIAYKQPITKIEVENIRGVSCDYAVNRLLEYDLIKELGRKDAPGRPILFGTTEQFLRSFGVKDLSDLPSLNTVKVEEFKEEAEEEVNARIGV